MKRLTVLYDPTCGFCLRCKAWLQRQDQLLPLEFLAQGGDEARRRFPSLRQRVDPDGQPDELIAVGDDGQVFRDTRAWIMCLYALRDYRGLAMTLGKPAFRPYARRAYALVAGNRRRFSKLMGRQNAADLEEALRYAPDPPRCAAPADAKRDAFDRLVARAQTGAAVEHRS